MIVRKGHHLRLVVTFSAGASTPQVSPAPTVTIYRDAKRRSAIALPIIPAG
jgi:hypothetical protein